MSELPGIVGAFLWAVGTGSMFSVATVYVQERQPTAPATQLLHILTDLQEAQGRDNTESETVEDDSSGTLEHVSCGTPEDNSWKAEASKNFTVAPAYNKGAYQVIPRKDVEHIGK